MGMWIGRNRKARVTYGFDEIALVPGREGYVLAATEGRWGAAATLRGGAGTARERVDLLAELLTRAGWTTEVWAGAPVEADAVLALAARPVGRPFAPVVDGDTVNGWVDVLGVDPYAADLAPFDADGSAREAVLAPVRTAGLDAPASAPWPVAAPALLPFVRATRDGVTVDLQPNLADASFGDPGVVDATPAPDAGPLDDLVVRLEGVRDDGSTVTLVEGAWDAARASGSILEVGFATPYGLADATRVRAQDVQTFVPTLRWLPTAGASFDAATEGVLGDPVDRGGATWSKTATGYDRGGAAVRTEPSDPDALARVASLRVRLDAATFPEVEARVAALDAAGLPIAGLGADAFEVAEDAVGQRAWLLASEPVTPRVQLLFDRSDSVPSAFRDDVGTLGHAIAAAIFDAVPGATIQVAGLDLVAPSVAGPFVSELAAVDAQLAGLGGAGSDVWNNLAVTAAGDATAVILVSDFLPDAEPDATAPAALVAGPPVLLAAVGEPDTAVVETLAAWTLGEVWSPGRIELADAAAAFVAERAAETYRLTWRAPSDGTAPRTVVVDAPATATSAEGAYVPPDAPVVGPSWAALTLTVQSGDRVVRRPLAQTPEAVSAMWFGRALLAFEAGSPSVSAILDDHLADRIAYEPLYDGVVAADGAAVLAAFDAMVGRVPPSLRLALADPSDAAAAAAVFPDGLRAALWVETPVWDGSLRQRLDLLGLSRRRSADPDASAGFAETLRRSAFSAALETARFDASTGSLLADEPLGVFDPLTIDLTLGPAWRAPVDAWPGRTILAPLDGDPVAFWAVDPETGEVVGVLGDGSGGAVADEVEQTLREVGVILDIARRVGALGGFNGIEVWADLEETKANVVGAATIVIGEGGPGFDPGEVIQEFLEDQAKDALFGMVPGYTEASEAWEEATGPISDLNSLWGFWGAMTGSEAPEIPYTEFGDAVDDLLGLRVPAADGERGVHPARP